MAYMIPDVIPSDANATPGEKTLFGALRDGLPDDFIVWYEPIIEQRYPDIIVLGPTFGLLILEVKDWSIDRIIKADSHQFHIEQGHGNSVRVAARTSPLRQAQEFFCLISDNLKRHSVLCYPDGPHKGKLMFPIGKGAVMSNLTEAEAQKTSLDSVLQKPSVAYKDELLSWQGMSDRQLIRRLKDMFAVKFNFYALTDDQINTIKGVLHPEIQIRIEPATRQSLPAEIEATPARDSKVIISLDPNQESLARKLRDGHRLLSGVAGSGKTLILMARAKFLANEYPDYKILILCYHKSLAAYLRSLLFSDEYPNYQQQIEVVHFNDWAKQILGKLPLQKSYPDEQTFRQALGKQVVRALEAKQDTKWDAILIDEAHAFAPEWFRCCVTALKHGEDGKLLISYDRNQKIHKRNHFTWKSVGVKARGRTKRLYYNYRNTREILQAAWGIITLNESSQGDREDDPAFLSLKPSASRKSGSRPVLHFSKNLKQSVLIAHQQIEDFKQAGYLSKDIAVVFHSRATGKRDWLKPLIKRLKDSKINVYWMSDDRSKRNYKVQASGVRLVSVESALGLEFKAAIIMEAERFVKGHEEDAVRYRQLYVAMTRALEVLHVIGDANHPFTKTLEATENFEVRNSG